MTVQLERRVRVVWAGERKAGTERGGECCQGNKRREPEACRKEEVDFSLKHVRRIAGKTLLRILKGENLPSPLTRGRFRGTE